jgi:hypothetical protein
MLSRIAAGFVLALGVQLSAAHSAELDPQQIGLIRDTAASICNTVKDIKGERTDIQVQGEVKGQLSGLLGRLASAGASGAGTLSRDEFEGLSQDATAIAVAGDRECREHLFDKMFDKITATTTGGTVIQQPNGTNSPTQNGNGNTVIINGVTHPGDRPWLAIDGSSQIGDLFISDDFTPAFNFNVQVRVTGDQPAQKIAGLGLLLPFDGDGGALLEAQKERCNRAVHAPTPQGGTRLSLTLMPGQVASIPVFLTDEGGFRWAHEHNMTKLPPTIVGCVIYEDNDGNGHWTGLIYDMFARDPNTPSGLTAINLKPGTLAAGNIVLRQDLIGTGPAN